MKYYAIIVAGGSGNRMQTEIPKQFLLLKNIPILMHTIKAFQQCATQPEILLVLNPDQHDYWNRLCKEFKFDVPHVIIDGGTERFYSVQNAINAISEMGYVAIHDAVRPLVSTKLIDHCYRQAEALGNMVTAVQSSDSVRRLFEGETSTLKRDEIFLVQTPQTFSLNTLKAAYRQEYDVDFTDDASVVESLGLPINIIEGERSNIKITFPFDLQVAELLLERYI